MWQHVPADGHYKAALDGFPPFRTDMSHDLDDAVQIACRAPLGGLGEPEDLAWAVLSWPTQLTVTPAWVTTPTGAS